MESSVATRSGKLLHAPSGGLGCLLLSGPLDLNVCRWCSSARFMSHERNQCVLAPLHDHNRNISAHVRMSCRKRHRGISGAPSHGFLPSDSCTQAAGSHRGAGSCLKNPQHEGNSKEQSESHRQATIRNQTHKNLNRITTWCFNVWSWGVSF